VGFAESKRDSGLELEQRTLAHAKDPQEMGYIIKTHLKEPMEK